MSEIRETKPKEKSGGVKALILAALLVGVLAAAIGWFLGSRIDDATPVSLEETRINEHVTDNKAGSAIVELTPILTNLREPQEVWVRMEVSLVTKEPHHLTPQNQAEISNDFIALLRQMTLAQIKGPTGLMNLREDLLDRARIRSEGQVSALLISHLVIE